MDTLTLLFTLMEIWMYLTINNFEKILTSPHPLYTCVECDTKDNFYIFQIVDDEFSYSYKVFIDRNRSKVHNKYGFRIESTNIANGFDYGVLSPKDLNSKALLFKLLCEAIEEIKVFK